MAKMDDPFGFSECAKIGLEQTHQANGYLFRFSQEVHLGISVRRN